MEEYLDFLGTCLCALRPDIVVHRLTGDGPKPLLVAPLWTSNKRLVLNQMGKVFKEKGYLAGKNLSYSLERKCTSCQKHLLCIS